MFNSWLPFWGYVLLVIPAFLLTERSDRRQLLHAGIILLLYLIPFLLAYASLSEVYSHRTVAYWNKTEIGFWDPTGTYTFEPEFVGEGNYHAILLLSPVLAFLVLWRLDRKWRTKLLVYALLLYPAYVFCSYKSFADPGTFYVDTRKPETYVDTMERSTAPSIQRVP